ncbi:MAG: helix-turn-helix domain-containing protein [Massiliimalia sp.]
MEQISRKLGYSKEYFSKLFKECVGENYKAFLDYVRISEAQRMIKFEGLPITVVAERVGYQSLCSFSRAFKRMTGHPPTSEYL